MLVVVVGAARLVRRDQANGIFFLQQRDPQVRSEGK